MANYRPNRRLNELSDAELNLMIERCEVAAVQYSDEIKMGMLSTSSYNIYQAIEDAIRGEYAKARATVPIYRHVRGLF